MKNKLCFIVITVCVFCLLSTNLFAANSTQKSIDLKLALDMALSSNLSLKSFDQKIEYATQRYNLSYAQSAAAKGKGWEDDVQLISNKKAEILFPIQRKNALEQLKWEKQNTINSLKIDITKAYYQILNKDTLIKLRQTAIERLNKELEVKKEQVKKGLDIQTSVTNLQLSISQEIQKLEGIKRDRDILVIRFNSNLGRDIEDGLSLIKEDLNLEYFTDIDTNKIIQNQLLKNNNIIKISRNLEEAKSEYDIIKRYSYAPDTNGIEDVRDNILDLEYKLKDAKLQLEVDILSEYNSLLNLHDSIEINQIEYEKCQKLTETSQAKFKTGKITAIEKEKVQANQDEALFTLEQSKIDYFVACENFKVYLN